ncbi:MAG: hypothetical protein R3E74_03220 [Pseudomonadales bacterium]
MEFVRGSHADGKYYRPELFGARENHPASWATAGDGEKVPDIESDRESFDIVGWDMKAGDAVLFADAALSPGQARRHSAVLPFQPVGWGMTPSGSYMMAPTRRVYVSVQPGDLAQDDKVFPLVWQR